MTIKRWVDKLNRWALKGLPRAIQSVKVSSEGITLIQSHQPRFLRWSEIREIAVLKQPYLASTSFALAIRVTDSTVTIIDDTVEGHMELCEELPRRLPGVIPYEEWAVELMAKKQDAGMVIFQRTTV